MEGQGASHRYNTGLVLLESIGILKQIRLPAQQEYLMNQLDIGCVQMMAFTCLRTGVLAITTILSDIPTE